MGDKIFARNCILVIIFSLVLSVTCVIRNSVSDAYPNMNEAQYVVESIMNSHDFSGFSHEVAVVYQDEDLNADIFSDCYYVLLIDDTEHEVLAAKNAHRRMYPASMTKVMTAIVVADAVEAGEISLDDVVTVSEHYDLTQYDVAPCQLFPGYQITVKDLVYGLMIESNNYYALILAKYLDKNVVDFCKRMNEKAASIGATNSNFMNPHGLDNPRHYSTAYDMYLILQEAQKHSLLREIDSFDTYSYSYKDASGASIAVECSASNQFLVGGANLPATFEIETWKTGTTNGAGHCLAMYVTKDKKQYFVVASTGESKSILYDSIVKLLCLIN